MERSQVAYKGAALLSRRVMEAKCGRIFIVEKHDTLQSPSSGRKLRSGGRILRQNRLPPRDLNECTSDDAAQPHSWLLANLNGRRQLNLLFPSGLEHAAREGMLGVLLQARSHLQSPPATDAGSAKDLAQGWLAMRERSGF